jgi:hypothetical protein
MRTVALSLVLALTTAVAMAFHPSSSVHVVLMGHHPAMTVIFNGQAYRPGMQQLTFSGLAPGIYPLRVMRPGHPARATVYAGSVHVPALSNVQVNVMPHGGVQVHSTPIAVVHHVPAPVHGPGWCGTPVQVGMAPNTFAALMNTVAAQGFDSNRLAIAMQGIRMNGATSVQVADLMGLLSFESRRLELAKFAYAYVADPQNYFVVNDRFSFSSSVRELNRHMHGH